MIGSVSGGARGRSIVNRRAGYCDDCGDGLAAYGGVGYPAYHERRWVVADENIYWVQPSPSRDDSWDQVLYELPEALAGRARALGIA